ncbi:hypothetical protein RJZ90_002516 [Blastomyces dermatitidis]
MQTSSSSIAAGRRRPQHWQSDRGLVQPDSTAVPSSVRRRHAVIPRLSARATMRISSPAVLAGRRVRAVCRVHSAQTSSSGFMFPQPGTSATTTPPTDPTSTRPVVPNALFPFPIIPTTFSNQDACVSAYTDCQVQYSSCTASLGGVNGVTIGGAGGITVPGVQPTAGNPVSVCSSLSTEACHGLQVGYCTAFRDGVGSGGVAARGGGGLLYDIVVGVAVAIAGMVV